MNILMGDSSANMLKLKDFVKNSMIRVPHHIASRYKNNDSMILEAVGKTLKKNYFTNFPSGYLETDIGKNDFENHLVGRLTKDRHFVIQWLDHARCLQGSRVLEVGCGTGCSTVALAEQGAIVTAIDVDERALIVAKDRCDAYGLTANFINTNANKVHDLFGQGSFDFIIFFATLEHLTLEERLIALKGTWDMLGVGNLWVVVQTPNRLWYYDSHTSQLPFFMWLPDELAFMYSRFSPRANFREVYGKDNGKPMFHFLRRGRGVSFHEFDLTMEPAERLNVISCLSLFHRQRNPLWRAAWRFSKDHHFESLLRKVGPNIHRGFYQPYLDLIIKKR